MPQWDLRIADSNYWLIITDLQTEHEVTGGPSRDVRFGFNPGLLTLKAKGGLQIVPSGHWALSAASRAVGAAAVTTAAAAAAADPSAVPPAPEAALPQKWQVGFYQVLFSLKRDIFRQTEIEGPMAAVARTAGAGGVAHRRGYLFEREMVEVTKPCRDASDSTDSDFAPWYDSNGSLSTGLKHTFLRIGQNIMSHPPTSFSLSMGDSPGVIPRPSVAGAKKKVIGMKQEASFMTFLLMLNTDRRDKVFVLTAWSWTANFLYLKPGDGAPITRGGIVVTSHDKSPRFIRQMPYPEIPDRPVGKDVLAAIGEGRVEVVPNLDLYLI